jgi:hypothetical protein
MFLQMFVNGHQQRGLHTKRPTIVFFMGLTKPFPSYDIRQARTDVLVKIIDEPNTAVVAWLRGEGVKTTENKILGPVCHQFTILIYHLHAHDNVQMY